MRLKKLYIEKHNILQDFNLYFEDSVSVFVGLNGSGKSTVLEVLARIFRNTHLSFSTNKNIEFDFNFSITYEINIETQETLNKKNTVVVTIDGKSAMQGKLTIDVNDKYFEHLTHSENRNMLLPDNVIIYYAGWFEAMQRLCLKHEELYKHELKESAKTSEGIFNPEDLPMLYIQNYHFSILLACLLGQRFNENIDNLLTELKIDRDAHFMLEISIRKGNAPGKNPSDFWGLKGLLFQTLSLLRSNSQYYQEFKKNDTEISFSLNLDEWFEISSFNKSASTLFYNLHMLDSYNMLADINIFFQKDNAQIRHKEISEGERQLITIKAIKELLIQNNTLLLFDEPDVYLHPSWQGTFVSELKKENEKVNAHYVISSHSPFLLTNYKGKGVYLMEKGESDFAVSFYGRTVEEILLRMGGVVYLSSEKIEKEIKLLFRLISQAKTLKEIERVEEKYENLVEEIGQGEDDMRLHIASSEIEFKKSEMQ